MAKPSIGSQEDRLRERYKDNNEVQLVQSWAPSIVDGVLNGTNWLNGNAEVKMSPYSLHRPLEYRR